MVWHTFCLYVLQEKVNQIYGSLKDQKLLKIERPSKNLVVFPN